MQNDCREHDAEVAAQQFEHRKKRDHLPVGNAVCFTNGDPTRSTALCQLEAEAALPDSRVPDDTGDLSLTFDGAVECCLQSPEFGYAADKPGQARRASDFEPRV